MSRLVERFGHMGFAALTSLGWALPMAAWAGSADLSPIDRTAFPGIALALGVVMLAGWVGLMWWIRRIPGGTRPHRLDVARMSAAEKRWLLAFAGCAIVVIGWLNAAATVDWSPLVSGVAAGRMAAVAFALGLGAVLLASVAGAVLTWRRAAQAFASRVASLSNVS